MWLAAAELAREQLERAPRDPAAWASLIGARLGAGAWHAALTESDAAIAACGAAGQLLAQRARALIGLERLDDALAQAEEALRATPQDAAVMRLRESLESRLGRARSRRRGLAECDAVLATRPADAQATYQRALALARRGDGESARAIMSLRRFVSVSALALPDGFGAESLRAALTDEIVRNPTLASDPRGHATRNGRQTRRLRQPGAEAIEALLRSIQDAVDDYEARLARRPEPFARGRPAEARLQSWAVVSDGHGYQRPHAHPDGWLSGVYFVTAPLDGGRFRGDLLLGAHDDLAPGMPPPWRVRRIEPRPGRLVMFPSYLPHATAPSGCDDLRISVAFDVVPVDRAAD